MDLSRVLLVLKEQLNKFLERFEQERLLSCAVASSLILIVVTFVAFKMFFKKNARKSDLRKDKIRDKKKKAADAKQGDYQKLTTEKKKSKTVSKSTRRNAENDRKRPDSESEAVTEESSMSHSRPVDLRKSDAKAVKKPSDDASTTESEGDWITVKKTKKSSDVENVQSGVLLGSLPKSGQSRSSKLPAPPSIPQPSEIRSKMKKAPQGKTLTKKGSRNNKTMAAYTESGSESIEEPMTILSNKPRMAETEEDTWHEVVSAKKKRQRVRKD